MGHLLMNVSNTSTKVLRQSSAAYCVKSWHFKIYFNLAPGREFKVTTALYRIEKSTQNVTYASVVGYPSILFAEGEVNIVK